MSNSAFLKPWHGIPREEINWHPTVIESACIGCGTCVTGCSRLVYRYDFARQKPVVADPIVCMVGCTTCANTCPASAITFPSLETVLGLERLALVRHAIEDDLVGRKEQLAWADGSVEPAHLARYRVTSIQDTGPRTRIISLQPRTEADCFCVFAPGQYVELHLPGQQLLGRAYSIGNAPRPDGSMELQVRRAAEGRFTQVLFEGIEVGDELLARGPLGNFTMRSPKERKLLFVAAGTAFAPVKALIEQQLQLFPQRDMTLIWGCRAMEDFYELDALELWRKQGVRVRLAVESSAPVGAIPTTTGNVADAIAVTDFSVTDLDAYVAGPRPAVSATVRALLEKGMTRENIFVDTFGA